LGYCRISLRDEERFPSLRLAFPSRGENGEQATRLDEDRIYGRAGVTPQQHQALLAIKGFPGRESVDVGDLAERLQHRHHSTVELVDRLVSLKLVVRKRSSADRRRVQVQLTERGERILDRLSSAHHEQLRRIGPQMSVLLKRLRS
jgi:DNA-binding MarR family transcriptional regulator